MKQVGIATLLILLIACASTSKHEHPCLPEKQVTTVLSYMKKVADRNADDNNIPKTDLSLEQSSCDKRIYSKNGYRILVYQNPINATGDVQGSLSNKEKLGNAECLSKAVTDVTSLDPKFSRIIELHRQKWSWLWNDYDIGPAKWLSCDKKGSKDWLPSLDTFVHELNHEIREGNCIRRSKDSTPLCLDLSSELPVQDLAA